MTDEEFCVIGIDDIADMILGYDSSAKGLSKEQVLECHKYLEKKWGVS